MGGGSGRSLYGRKMDERVELVWRGVRGEKEGLNFKTEFKREKGEEVEY